MASCSDLQRNLIQRVNVGDSLTRTAARHPHGIARRAAVVADDALQFPARRAARGVDLFERELHALAEGRPLKAWKQRQDFAPTTGLADG